MNLRELVTFVIALALTIGDTPLSAEAQTGKVPHVGVVVPGSSSSFAPRVAAFRQGLRDLGYVERQNIVVEYRFALVRLNVQAIVTLGTPATLAAKPPNGSKRSRRSFRE